MRIAKDDQCWCCGLNQCIRQAYQQACGTEEPQFAPTMTPPSRSGRAHLLLPSPPRVVRQECQRRSRVRKMDTCVDISVDTSVDISVTSKRRHKCHETRLHPRLSPLSGPLCGGRSYRRYSLGCSWHRPLGTEPPSSLHSSLHSSLARRGPRVGNSGRENAFGNNTWSRCCMAASAPPGQPATPPLHLLHCNTCSATQSARTMVVVPGPAPEPGSAKYTTKHEMSSR